MQGKLYKNNNSLQNKFQITLVLSGLPHTQGIQGNSWNFEVEENLR